MPEEKSTGSDCNRNTIQLDPKTTIEELKISIRLSIDLKRHGVRTVEDLLTCCPEQWPDYKRLRGRSHQELETLISNLKEGKVEKAGIRYSDLLNTSYEDCSLLYKKVIQWGFLKSEFGYHIITQSVNTIPFEIYGITDSMSFLKSLEDQGYISGPKCWILLDKESGKTVEDILPRVKGSIINITEDTVSFIQSVELGSIQITEHGRSFLERCDYLGFLKENNISEKEFEQSIIGSETAEKALLKMMRAKEQYYYACKLALDKKDYKEYSLGLCEMIMQEYESHFSSLAYWEYEYKIDGFLSNSTSIIDFDAVNGRFKELSEKDNAMALLILNASNKGIYDKNRVAHCYGMSVEEGLSYLNKYHDYYSAELPSRVENLLGYTSTENPSVIAEIQKIYSRVVDFMRWMEKTKEDGKAGNDGIAVNSLMKIDLFRHDRMKERESIFLIDEWRRILQLRDALSKDRATIVQARYGIRKKDIEKLNKLIKFLKTGLYDSLPVSACEKMLRSDCFKWYLEQMSHNLSNDSLAGSRDVPSFISYCKRINQDEKWGLMWFGLDPSILSL